MAPFTLEPKRWYACELVGDEFHDWGEDLRSYSPIRVDRLSPLKRGNRTFELAFFHQNYPEGVQDKTYTLETLERGERYLLTRTVGKDPPRILLFYALQMDWIRRHFPGYSPTGWDLKQWFGQEPARRTPLGGAGMRVYGLDFTSAPKKRTPLTCAVCTLHEGALNLEELRPLDGFPGFEELLASPGPWIMGLDFPFGQPRKLIENLGWPQCWEEYVRHVESMGKQAFEDALRNYAKGRGKGDKHHLRVTDRLAGAQSPMKLDFVPVAKMFFQGAPRLARAGVSVLPCRPAENDRIAVEAYPALVARRAIGRRSYKEENASAKAEAKMQARAEILRWIAGDPARQHFGFAVCMEDSTRARLAADGGGDLLDSVLCAVEAAWAWMHRGEGFGFSAACDPVEGSIADPMFWGNSL